MTQRRFATRAARSHPGQPRDKYQTCSAHKQGTAYTGKPVAYSVAPRSAQSCRGNLLKLIAILPVDWDGIVGAHHDDDNVRIPAGTLGESICGPVGPCAMPQHSGSWDPIIPYLIVFAKQAPQHGWIALRFTIRKKSPVGDAVANAGNPALGAGHLFSR